MSLVSNRYAFAGVNVFQSDNSTKGNTNLVLSMYISALILVVSTNYNVHGKINNSSRIRTLSKHANVKYDSSGLFCHININIILTILRVYFVN